MSHFISVSKGAKEAFHQIAQYCIHLDKPCPNCGKYTLLQPGGIDKTTGKPFVPPVCYSCGWKESNLGYSRQMFYRKQQYRMRKHDCQLYFKNYNIMSHGQVMSKTLSQFKAKNKEQKNAKKTAKEVINNLAKGKIIHCIITGNVGSGKTHIACGIINALWKLTSYDYKVVFINLAKSALVQHEAINNRSIQRQFDKIIHQIPKADLVVLDDVGRERANPWNQMIVDATANERVDKPIIVTCNLQVLERYPKQTSSRIEKHASKSKIRFRRTPNQRH